MQTALTDPVWLRFLLAALATWRVTHLLANEDGPADIVFHLRRRLGESWIGGLMDCFNCLSFWIAAPAAVFVSAHPLEWAISWLALSGAACLLERLGAGPTHNVDDRPNQGDDHVLR